MRPEDLVEQVLEGKDSSAVVASLLGESAAMQYAVNIGDMTLDKTISSILLAPLIKDRSIIKAEKTVDGGAVRLEGTEERIKAAIAVVRMKYSKARFRFYESKTGKSWKRV